MTTQGAAAAAEMSQGNVVEVHGLHVTLHRNGERILALRGIDLSIGAGEIVGVVGESGSGKSVLGLTLLGLLPASARPVVDGYVEVCGVDQQRTRRAQRRDLLRRDLGAVFQDPMTSLNPTMRIGRQLQERCGSGEEAVRLLDAVGVPHAAARLQSYPHELSGGLRQRVMIAMAIAGRPKLVIADEPTTALDVTIQAQILELLVDLRNEMGTAFLFVTHDLGVAAEIADRLVVAYGGQIMEVGGSDEVLQRPMHPYTRGLLRSRITMSSPRGRPLPTLAGSPPDPRNPPPGCAFQARCDQQLPSCSEGVFFPLSPSERASHRSACPVVRGGEVLELGAPGGPQFPPARVDSAPVLQLRDVRKSFPVGSDRLQALRGIDLSIAAGESVALVGESGCGKSTLLRVVAGLTQPSSGTVELASDVQPQMVFQDAGASLTPWLTVGELVGERLRAVGASRVEREARTREVLQRVGLSAGVGSTVAAQLSGGQRQRVSIARAIVVPPPVLLCDEPTSALDASLAAIVLNLLNELRRDLGMAMIFVTHDLASARVMADRAAVMYLGRIVEEGDVDDVTTSPRHPYTRALLSAIPSPERRRIPLIGEPASPLAPPAGCAFHTRCPDAVEACRSADPLLIRGLACAVHGDPLPLTPDHTRQLNGVPA